MSSLEPLWSKVLLVGVSLGTTVLLGVEFTVLTVDAIVLVGDTESADDDIGHGPGSLPEHLDVKLVPPVIERTIL